MFSAGDARAREGQARLLMGIESRDGDVGSGLAPNGGECAGDSFVSELGPDFLPHGSTEESEGFDRAFESRNDSSRIDAIASGIALCGKNGVFLVGQEGVDDSGEVEGGIRSDCGNHEVLYIAITK